MVWEKHYNPPGAHPGTLSTPPSALQDTRLTAIHYTSETYQETAILDLPAYLQTLPSEGILWLNLEGLGNLPVLEYLGQHFGLHDLSLEDVLSVPQRSKLEDHDTYVFMILHTQADPHTEASEQISLFLGPSYVLTIQEHPGGLFEPVRQRLRQAHGKIRHHSADYLAYALVDAAIDTYFPFLEVLAERLEVLEDEVLTAPTRQTLERIYTLRRFLTNLRRTIWPLREAISAFSRHDADLVTEQTRFFLRDCYDHLLQIQDVLESYREMVSGLLETHISFQSHHLNEVMKVLTIISTIFMPLSFIAGIYGMNFNTDKSPLNMPELQWYWGYPAVLGGMGVVALSLLLFFRSKDWL